MRLPNPPSTVHTYKYEISQNYACRWQYPYHSLTVRAYHTTAGAGGWSCYIP